MAYFPFKEWAAKILSSKRCKTYTKLQIDLVMLLLSFECHQKCIINRWNSCKRKYAKPYFDIISIKWWLNDVVNIRTLFSKTTVNLMALVYCNVMSMEIWCDQITSYRSIWLTFALDENIEVESNQC